MKRCCCIWPEGPAGYWSAPQSEEEKKPNEDCGNKGPVLFFSA